jgi:hypothetical protein
MAGDSHHMEIEDNDRHLGKGTLEFCHKLAIPNSLLREPYIGL